MSCLGVRILKAQDKTARKALRLTVRRGGPYPRGNTPVALNPIHERGLDVTVVLKESLISEGVLLEEFSEQ